MAERAAGDISGTANELDIAGPAPPIRLKPAPSVSAEAAGDLLTVKHGAIFVCSDRDGNIYPGVATGQGLFLDDTRFLSELRLTIGGKDLLLLSASAELGYEAFVELTNPDIPQSRAPIPQMTLNIRRRRLVAERVYEHLEIKNHSSVRTDTWVDLSVGADFADMFEIRGVSNRLSRGHALVPKIGDRALTLGYIGEDEVVAETLVEFGQAVEIIDAEGQIKTVRWRLELEPGAAGSIDFTITPASGQPLRPPGRAGTETEVRDETRLWTKDVTRIHGLHRSFNRLVQASTRDLEILRTPIDGQNVIVAGIPWYVAPFGRDALITCYESMLLTPEPARDALLFLAKHQARADDRLRDAEPGKILHELRLGELARAGLIPHTPYFGTVDATPLFLMLAAAYYRWTADVETMTRLKPSLDAALDWITLHGDSDGDGFVEYERRSPAGLANQGWKDSEDSIVHAGGSLADGPIALVEVQAYVYLAKARVAEVYAALGEPDRARALRAEAERLKTAFNEAFWMPDEGTYALALDGAKRQVASVTSNAGHCLYCSIVPDDRAGSVVERLMAEDMFSGWGIRTLSSESPVYNPMSYHNGSVWPHDNAIIAAGFKRYGFADATEAIALALTDAAGFSREARLPELYCGFRRRESMPFVHYPVACRPQAWAAAVPFMILQAMLGISANAPEGVVTINQPHVPEWLGRLELHDLRVGASRISLAFSRDGERTTFALLGKEGDVRVSMLG